MVLGLVLVAALHPRLAHAKSLYGAVVLDEVTDVEEGRFRSKRDWERTIRFFYSVYGKKTGVVWKALESTAKVKAVHIQNTAPGRKWDGINVYETKDGKVFIYVLKARPAKTDKKS
jgi:hypothetical protein